MDSLSRPGDEQRRLRLSSKTCPQCDGAVALDSPHVRIARSGIEVFCTSACLRDAIDDVPSTNELQAFGFVRERRRQASRATTVFVLGLGVATLSPCAAHRYGPALVQPVIAMGGERHSNLEVAALDYGPHPPTDDELADEFAASLGINGWVHPLPGPNRRMPIRESRAFGADRPGDRPYECRSGHCGVDIGGQQWGEQILASGDAIVDKVNRSPSHSGGLYVRLSHNDGTVFTQYFHLAAIPKGLQKGVRVRAGDVIGLLGETGIVHAEPHLHFTVSVRASPDAPEVYIDPEPLIALWPMRELRQGFALAGDTPGVPIGASGRYKSKRARPKAIVSSSEAKMDNPAIGSPALAGPNSAGSNSAGPNSGGSESASPLH